MFASLLELTITLLGALPVRVRSDLGKVIGAIAGLVPSRERSIALAQLRVFMPEAASLKTVMSIYAGMGQTLMESLNLRPILKDPTRYVTCPNWDYIEALRNRERPIITFTAHLANWDLLAAYFVKRGIPITTVGREARRSSLQSVLSKLRTRYGIRTIWRSDRNGLREILDVLRSKGVVAALIDQDTHVTSLFSPFFGQPVRTPSALAALGIKKNALFVSAFIVRTGLTRYTIYVKEFDPALGVDELLEQFNKRLEDYIRSYPSQWVWVHKRWRSLVDGRRFSSRQYLSYLESRRTERPDAGVDALPDS